MNSDKFFGREKELALLQKKIDDLKKGYRHNVAILGKRLSGKTSLLLQFLSTVDKTDTVAIYLDLSALSFTGFVDQFIGMMLYGYKTIEDNAECNLNFLIDNISSLLPKTHQKIKNIYSSLKAEKPKPAFEELFDLPSHFSKESGKFCIVILDNFSKLLDYNLPDPFAALGDKIMLQKTAFYILSDCPNINSKSIISEKLSMLFGKFQAIDLEPFSQQESMIFIDSMTQELILSTEFKKFIAHFSGGEPFYLYFLTQAIIKKASQKKLPIFTEDELCHIVYECIFDNTSPINQHFSLIIEKYSGSDSPRETIKVLNSIIRKNKASDIAQDSRCQKKQVYKLLEKFTACDIVIKNGLLYAIEDEVFKAWLRLKEIEVTPQFKIDQKSYMEKFIHGIKCTLEGFFKEQNKPLDNKILNLVSAFNNEKLTVGKGTHILPAFKHIHTESATGENVVLSAHGTKLWIFSISKEMVNEDTIFDFISHCKRQKHKVSRKVLITLKGITAEAKLLAIQEHIWIWPQDKLNSLLNLYGKPKVAISW